MAPLVAVILAIGLGVTALAGGESAKPGPPAITGSIRLAHADVRSGGTIRGRLVFENRTSKAQVLLRGCRIDGLYAIALRASDGYLTSPGFSLVGCSPEQELVARPGTTVYRFTVAATYTECSQGAAPPRAGRRSKDWIPSCLEDSRGERDVMPPLPPGRYTASFVPDGKWHGPHVKSARVVVTRAR